MITIKDISTDVKNEAILLVKESLRDVFRWHLIKNNIMRIRNLAIYILAIEGLVCLLPTSFSWLATLGGLLSLSVGYLIMLMIFTRQTMKKIFPDFYPGPFYSYWQTEPHLRRFWVAVDNDGKVVGTAAIKRISAEVAELVRMSVSLNTRNQGVGSMLTKYVVDHCRHDEYQTLLLNTLPAYREARSLYQKEGFHTLKMYSIRMFFFMEILTIQMSKELLLIT